MNCAVRSASNLVSMPSAPSVIDEHSALEAARSGDTRAFELLIERHQPSLHAHCYRMLGSLHDADDALQEALLRVWRALPRFEGRSSLHTWLFRIATNACLDLLARRRKRVLPIDYGPPSDPAGEPSAEPLADEIWIEPYPDERLGLEEGYASPEARYEQREAVELAFVAAMQHLPATQRAVLILREVLGFSAREVAESLETTVASVNSALQRARKTVDDRLPEQTQQETLRSLGEERVRSVVESYVDAWERGDVHALLALLAEDAVFSMPPWATWWRGRETIAGFAPSAAEFCAESRVLPTQANGQPAVAYYHLNAETGRWTPAAIDVITFEGALIKEVTAFVSPEVFEGFGLPPELGSE
jgi:RNA polymerase sigma-70 factor, ECF subfamily